MTAAFLAAILAFGLLHGGSMMITAANAAGIDCHGSAAKFAADYPNSMHHDIAQGATGDPYPSPIKGQQSDISSCPLANVSGLEIFASTPSMPRQATRVLWAGMTKLVSAIPDLLDPPPRLSS